MQTLLAVLVEASDTDHRKVLVIATDLLRVTQHLPQPEASNLGAFANEYAIEIGRELVSVAELTSALHDRGKSWIDLDVDLTSVLREADAVAEMNLIDGVRLTYLREDTLCFLGETPKLQTVDGLVESPRIEREAMRETILEKFRYANGNKDLHTVDLMPEHNDFDVKDGRWVKQGNDNIAYVRAWIWYHRNGESFARITIWDENDFELLDDMVSLGITTDSVYRRLDAEEEFGCNVIIEMERILQDYGRPESEQAWPEMAKWVDDYPDAIQQFVRELNDEHPNVLVEKLWNLK